MTEDGPLQYPSEGGDAACWLSQVCTECGAILEATPRGLCWRCGTDTDADTDADADAPAASHDGKPGANTDGAPPVRADLYAAGGQE